MKQIQKVEDKYEWMVSYQWTGVTNEARIGSLEKIIDFFQSQNKSLFCSDQFLHFFDFYNFGSEANYQFCLGVQNNTKNILFFINVFNESEGMKKELKLAKELGQGIFLLIKKEYMDLEWTKDFQKSAQKITIFENDFLQSEPEKMLTKFLKK